MKKRTLSDSALQRIKTIHKLSEKKNGPQHNNKLLAMIKHHIDEIKELMYKKDPHSITETGDLIILCMELILGQNGCIDSTLSKCYERFEKKLI